MRGLGPPICGLQSPDLARQFQEHFGPEVIDRASAQPKLDLAACVQATLDQAGVPSQQVETLDACTACDEERFFSHRRDAPLHGGAKGLHLSFVQCRFS
jgi:copper oxidase (laccase) domain-containing protein